MKLSQIEKRIPQTLTNSKDIIQTDRQYARRSSRARSTRGQENEAWTLYKKNPSQEPWGDLSGNQYTICPKPPYPAEKILNRRQLFFLAVPPWPVIKRLRPLELYSAPGAGPQKVYQTSTGQGYKGKRNNNEGGFTKLKTSKRYKWILALTAAFVQQDQIQREVSRWFTYLTDGTSGCIDKKLACYDRINR